MLFIFDAFFMSVPGQSNNIGKIALTWGIMTVPSIVFVWLGRGFRKGSKTCVYLLLFLVCFAIYAEIAMHLWKFHPFSLLPDQLLFTLKAGNYHVLPVAIGQFTTIQESVLIFALKVRMQFFYFSAVDFGLLATTAGILVLKAVYYVLIFILPLFFSFRHWDRFGKQEDA